MCRELLPHHFHSETDTLVSLLSLEYFFMNCENKKYFSICIYPLLKILFYKADAIGQLAKRTPNTR